LGKKVVFGASARSQAAGERVFEYCEAVLVPLGGIPAAYSPSGRADPTPGREIRYTKPPSGTSPGRPSERRFGDFARSHAALAWMFGHCEAVLVQLDVYLMVVKSPINRVGMLSGLRDVKTVTSSLLLVPVWTSKRDTLHSSELSTILRGLGINVWAL